MEYQTGQLLPLRPLFYKTLESFVKKSYQDVMKLYFSVRNSLKLMSTTKEPNVCDIVEEVSLKIEEVWQRASILTVSDTRVLQLLWKYNDKYRKLLKPYKSRCKEDS